MKYFVIALVLLPLSLCLQWIRFSVPEWAISGEDVLLTCEFDLEGQLLHTVRWYKSDIEFYHYSSSYVEPLQKTFSIPGVRVDVNRSDDQHVVLRNLTENSDGKYTCEIFTETPYFKIYVKSQQMTVVELPKGQPVVIGDQMEYGPGDTIHLNCSAPKSRPPANLTWSINGQQAPSDYLIKYSTPPDSSGRVSPLLGLKFEVTLSHFHNGELNMRCSARLGQLYEAEVIHNGVLILSSDSVAQRPRDVLTCAPALLVLYLISNEL